MSIQQSLNQAITGSLFLLNQTDAFQRMKAIKSAKREMEVNTEIGKMKGEVSDGSQEQLSANTAEGNPGNNVDGKVDALRSSMLEDMYMKLKKSVQEAEQAKKNSEEFRKKVLQGVYVKEDRWDGK